MVNFSCQGFVSLLERTYLLKLPNTDDIFQLIKKQSEKRS
jgi:hypothetical protein